MYRVRIALTWLLLLALLGAGGCHLIFTYEDRPADAATKDAGRDGRPRDIKAKLDGKAKLDIKPLPDVKKWPDLRQPDLVSPDLTALACYKDLDCDDKRTCTKDQCISGKCTNSIISGKCYIAGVCHAKDQKNPANDCLWCQPSAPTTWSPRSGSCDDNKKCTTLDFCQNGTCKGTPKPCDDKLPCTRNLCSQATGLCSNPHDPTKGCISADKKTCFSFNSSNVSCQTCGTSGLWSAKKKPCVSTFAGDGTAGMVNKAPLLSRFDWPSGISVIGATVYVADTLNHLIRKISGSMVYTHAGTGSCGYKYENSWADLTKASFCRPEDVLAYPGGTHLLVADTYYGYVRRIKGTDVYNIANINYASSKEPTALVVKPNNQSTNNSYTLYVSWRSSHQIMKYACSTTSNICTPYKLLNNGVGHSNGSFAHARFKAPGGMAFDSNGDIFVADTGNHLIRRIDLAAEQVSTVAGTKTAGNTNGSTTVATFSSPRDLVMDSNDDIYITDSLNHQIRKITVKSQTVETFAGGSSGFQNGLGKNALFNTPWGITLYDSKTLLVADRNNHRIRKIELP